MQYYDNCCDSKRTDALELYTLYHVYPVLVIDTFYTCLAYSNSDILHLWQRNASSFDDVPVTQCNYEDEVYMYMYTSYLIN